jgi:hypothetical protein
VAVHNGSAHTADTLPTVMVEGNRLFSLLCQAFIENIKHFQEGHISGNGATRIGLKMAWPVRRFLAPYLKGKLYFIHL